jgi:anti-sigma regulatory factor (Ser/Thr protein kinase)
VPAAESPDGPHRTSVELVGASPARARRAVAEAGGRAGLDQRDLDGLVLAVSEVVANAHLHGEPPVRVVIRACPGTVAVEVTDAGSGPGDPTTGLGPVAGPEALTGRGLWLAHHSCAEVVLRSGSDGFTVRLTGGEGSG